MAASIVLKDSTTARGARNYVSGSNFLPGRSVVMYVNGSYAGVMTTGPFSNVAYGSISADLAVPTSIPAGAAEPVLAQDNTKRTITASTTLTTT